MNPALRYAVALAAVALAWYVRLLLDPLLGDVQPFSTFYVAVALLALWGGWKPATLALALGFLAGDWFFLQPRGTLGVTSLADLARLLVYLVVTVTTVAVTEGMRRAWRRVNRQLEERTETARQLQFFKSLLEKSEDPFYIMHPAAEFRLLYVNAAMCRHFGRPEADLMRMRLWEWDPLFTRERAEAVWAHMQREGAQVFETVHLHADGHEIPVEISANSFEFEGQKFIAGYCHNITQRKRTEQALRESREMLRRVLDTVPARVFWKDRNSVYLGCNQHFARDAGLNSPEQIIGTDDFEQTWREQAELYRADDQEVMQTGQAKLNYEEPQTAPDGRRLWLCTSKVPLRDVTGEIIGVLGTYEDITERKRAEEALRQSEERLALAQQAGGVGVFDWNVETNETVWTSELEVIFGLAPGTFENRYEGWATRMHPADLPRIERLFREWLASDRETAEWEYRYFRHGQERWMAARGRVFRNAEGKALRMVGTNVDITDRKLAQEELERRVQERTAELRESIGELEHFSYTITHDMRAPLRAMQTFGKLLASEYAGGLDGTGRDFLRRIIESAARMDHLITDALSYSKVVRQEMELRPVDLGALLRGMVESYPEFESPQAEIEILDGIPPVIGNRAGLTQCFSNLLGNAVKFARPGERPRIRIWAETSETPGLETEDRNPGIESGFVRVWVEDNGIGIPQEYQERIFMMFQRLSRDCEGTGIGLALVRKVVERMRGRVGVESEPGKGSRFWVELRRT